MTCSFWHDVLANFLSDFSVGVIIGLPVAWWIGKKLNDLAYIQQRRGEKREDLEKAIHYLELLKAEIESLVEYLPRLIDAFEETGWGRLVRLRTPFWEILQPSGELPKVIRPELLGGLSMFYDNVMFAKQGIGLVVDGWLVSEPTSVPGLSEKQQAFVETTSHSLRESLRYGELLPDALDSELKHLQAEIEDL